MSLRCVYTDLDGTLLGKGGALFLDAEGNFSMAQTSREGAPAYGPALNPDAPRIGGEPVGAERRSVTGAARAQRASINDATTAS